MLPLDDPKWKELIGGYRIHYDPSPALRQLQSTSDTSDVWDELWQELHHQGDVGDASYAAVPWLVRIQNERGDLGWNLYSLVSVIEIERHKSGNPPIPEWLEDEYNNAIKVLEKLANEELKTATDKLLIRAILGYIALSKGLVSTAKILSNYGEEELKEMLNEHLGG